MVLYVYGEFRLVNQRGRKIIVNFKAEFRLVSQGC